MAQSVLIYIRNPCQYYPHTNTLSTYEETKKYEHMKISPRCICEINGEICGLTFTLGKSTSKFRAR